LKKLVNKPKRPKLISSKQNEKISSLQKFKLQNSPSSLPSSSPDSLSNESSLRVFLVGVIFCAAKLVLPLQPATDTVASVPLPTPPPQGAFLAWKAKASEGEVDADSKMATATERME